MKYLFPKGKLNPNWKEKVVKFCPICQKRFEVYPSRGKKIYCSPQCLGKSRAGIKRTFDMSGVNGSFWGHKHTKKAKELMRLRKLENPTRYWLNRQRPEMRKEVKSQWRDFRRQLRERTEYKQWIRTIFKKDNFTCQLCKNRGIEIQAHHLLSAKSFPQYILEIDNGVTLCKGCHQELNGNY